MAIDWLQNNTPSHKPELWDNLPRALVRQLVYRTLKWLHPQALHTFRSVIYDHDLTLRIALEDCIGLSAYLYGVYEYSVTQFIKHYLEPGMQVGDIGANRGYYTLLAAKRVGSQGSVHAFEPVPEIAEELRKNIEANGFQNVSPQPLVIADRPGAIPFYINRSRLNTGLSTLQSPVSLSSEIERKMIQATTLDIYFLQEKQIHPQLLKVDVEGAEAQVFQGGPQLLSGPDAPDIIFEVSGDVTPQEMLVQAGYRIYDLGLQPGRGVRLAPYDPQTRSSWYRSYEPRNLFASKKLRKKLELLCTE